MPIGNTRHIDAMRSGIDTLYRRMRAVQPHINLTHEDVLASLVPVEHRDILRTAAEVAHVSRQDRWIEVTAKGSNGGNAHFALLMVGDTDTHPPLSPRSPQWQEDMPPHVIAEIQSWVMQRLDLQRKFGLVEYVFDQLRNTLETGRQMRYVFPGALILAQNAHRDHIENGAAWAQKYADFSPQRHPALSVELRNAIREASAIVTTASMLPVDPPPASYRPVKIKLVGYYPFTLPGSREGYTFTGYGHHLEDGE